MDKVEKKDHKCGEELCIVCGFREKVSALHNCPDCGGYGFTNYGKGRDVQTQCERCWGTGSLSKQGLTP